MSEIFKADSSQRGGVLVVVPTLGTRLRWLADCITSVQESASRVSESVVIRLVAPSSAPVKAVADTYGVELLRSERPGLSAAINDGWSADHSARYVTWLGDDDLLAPESLCLSIRSLDREEDAAATYGKVRAIDGEGRTLWLMRPGKWAPVYMQIGKNLVPQPGSLFRWSALLEHGLLDESLRAAMDQELFSRLRRRARLAYSGSEVAAFRVHEGSITSRKDEGTGGEETLLVRANGNDFANMPLVRKAVGISDRLIFGSMRRLPVSAPPAGADGRPYTLPGALVD